MHFIGCSISLGSRPACLLDSIATDLTSQVMLCDSGHPTIFASEERWRYASLSSARNMMILIHSHDESDRCNTTNPTLLMPLYPPLRPANTEMIPNS
jgi:hypothetical protein